MQGRRKEDSWKSRTNVGNRYDDHRSETNDKMFMFLQPICKFTGRRDYITNMDNAEESFRSYK